MNKAITSINKQSFLHATSKKKVCNEKERAEKKSYIKLHISKLHLISSHHILVGT